jgi:hypothetical protein
MHRSSDFHRARLRLREPIRLGQSDGRAADASLPVVMPELMSNETRRENCQRN